MSQQDIIKFQKTIGNFYKKNKRSFPWRETKDPYKILVSEIMLQQTQVDRVIPYYQRFLKTFPTVRALAKANFSSIYNQWQGLGYNRRAMSLKKMAETVVKQHKGKLPTTLEELHALDGVGSYTAKAVMAFAYNQPYACVETNIQRALIHHFFPGQENVDTMAIHALANKCLDVKNPREWNLALMDYGASLKNNPTVGTNPNRRAKNYATQPTFEGSRRQIRGTVLRILKSGGLNMKDIAKHAKNPNKQLRQVLTTLANEGFITYDKETKKFLLS